MPNFGGIKDFELGGKVATVVHVPCRAFACEGRSESDAKRRRASSHPTWTL